MRERKRLWAVAVLSFSSGLPALLCGSTLQAWFTSENISIKAVGALTLVNFPYLLKFLWAPLLDRYNCWGLSRRKGWVMVFQVLQAVILIMLALMSPRVMPWEMALLATLLAFCSASQDTVIDAYRTEILTPKEYGLGATINTTGYYVASFVAGAAALILAALWGWRATYLLMALGMVGVWLLTSGVPDTLTQEKPSTLKESVYGPWLDLKKRPYIFLLLLLVVLYKLPDALALSLNTYFLMHGLHFTLLEIGSVSKIIWIVAMLGGTLCGGLLYTWVGLYRSLIYFGLFQLVMNLGFALLAMVGKSFPLMIAVIFFEKFSGGMATVAFVAFLSTLCSHRYTAAQFALLTALGALGRVLIGPLAAAIVSMVGWVYFYLLTFFLGLPVLVLLYFLSRRLDFSLPRLPLRNDCVELKK